MQAMLPCMLTLRPFSAAREDHARARERRGRHRRDRVQDAESLRAVCVTHILQFRPLSIVPERWGLKWRGGAGGGVATVGDRRGAAADRGHRHP
eukprot:2750153-Rhodomonas_salina.1